MGITGRAAGEGAVERNILDKLLVWKKSKYRKPLILEGVRQVGKTWALLEFGRRCYKNVAYVNFEEQPDYKSLFASSLEPGRLLQNLRMAGRFVIEPEQTLIVFDECQTCPQALTALKYFCEKAPEYHVVCAVSLPGIELAKPSSFPAGKVDFLNVYPMTFKEFLKAGGDENLCAYLESIENIEHIQEVFFNPLVEKLKLYFVTGGMPEPVRIWTEDRDTAAFQNEQLRILRSYRDDFGKYADPRVANRISFIWDSLSSQLARDNKKFMFSAVKKGARAREYADALQWLIKSRLVYQVPRSSAPALPLTACDDLFAFKLYLHDVGLLRVLSKLDTSVLLRGSEVFREFKGALAENFVLQELTALYESTPRYWSELNPPHEVDFLIQRKNEIFPIEVKADTNVRSPSLRKFKEKFPDASKLRIRISLSNLSLDDDLLNVPLFMVSEIDRLIEMALNRRS